MRSIHDGDSSEVEWSGAQEFDGQVEFGFQIATFQGPLCAEPVEGMAYFVQSVDIDPDALEQERSKCVRMRANTTVNLTMRNY
jgi:translation elongation factor EF-G